jgi:hypothetical protein
LRAPLHREYFHLPLREISLSNGCASICDCTGYSIAMFYIQSQKKQLTPSVFVHPDIADKNVQFNLTGDSAQLSSQLSLHSRIASVFICSRTYFENNKKARANTRMKQKHPKKHNPPARPIPLTHLSLLTSPSANPISVSSDQLARSPAQFARNTTDSQEIACLSRSSGPTPLQPKPK